MKKLLRWISIQLIYILILIAIISNSYSQVLWGMTSDGGSKKVGGNIFSINGDGTGFNERYAFFNDAEYPTNQRLLDYGDGYLYGSASNIIFRHLYDGSGYEAIYEFEDATGYIPHGRLLKGNDGFLYGTTSSGGNGHAGVVFKVKKDGTSYQIIHQFSFTDGSNLVGNLVQLNNGVIYGVAGQGGAHDVGAIYKVNPDGSGFSVMHSFNDDDGTGIYPDGGLVLVTVNNTSYLYGLAQYGGSNERGVIYRIKTDGTSYSRQYNFSSNSGQFPSGSLIKIGNILYGATSSGGNNNGGVLFAYDADADSYQKLRQFTYDPSNSSAENYPSGPLLNINGVLYGTTHDGGYAGSGVLYKINPDGAGYQVIHEFDEANQDGNLLYANNQIYGLTGGSVLNHLLYTHGTIYKLNTDGTSFQTIHSFHDHNGYGPEGSLIRGQDGKLYGLCRYGGGEYSTGLAFRIDASGNNYTPFALLGNTQTYLSSPGSLIQATNGEFYGVKDYFHDGAIYRISAGALYSYIQYYSPFCSTGCTSHPIAKLLQASDGYLYGMTPQSLYTDGAIYKIGTDGTNYSILKQFNTSSEYNPQGALIQGTDGYLYGMTENGGPSDYGAIFKIRTNGTGYQTIFQFGTYTSAYYGSHPKGSLIMASDGKLYGMTSSGGTFGGGTLFGINTDGTGITRLIDFNSVNGWAPVQSVIEYTSTGYLFGMTEQGGTSNFGVVFKIKKDGTGYQTLLNFDETNGKYPRGDLLIVPITAIPNNPPVISSAKKSNSVIEESKAVITVFPNPVKQSFTIRFQKQFSGRVNYTISDLSGRELIKKSIDRAAISEIKSVDISFLPAGTYLLELSTPKEKFTQKILKQ